MAIYGQMAEVYGNFMNYEALVQNDMFDGERMNIHDEESWSQPSVVTDGLEAIIEAKMHRDEHFKIYFN